ncbi:MULTISPECIES: peptidylprolyl isomerase [Acidiphilium]|uniref:Parvulin-like PPIase n=1 Tax=Acidiphilium rubrum TaxID=526 RepID=A0A8G2CHR8_ACIRU|nr:MULTISPECIES: peptidylprolyl isomerase [Acidiphilium]SIQ10013.1 peptidyl-prolyl cis-trans isomerase SurA [Acidiphilium rubrum]
MKSLRPYGFLLGLGAMVVASPGIARAQDARIAVVVNGTVITNQDVDARARLFALSAGLPPTSQTLEHLKPQITSELIDQALQLQAIEQNKIVVSQADIAAALARIDKANGLPPDGLQKKLEASGVPYSTLVGQFRTELGWTDVLKKKLGPDLRPTKEDVLAEQRAMKRELGETQYHIAEIFIPIERPSDEGNAKLFAQTVIKQLRNGAPFPVVAAQFSQSQSALTGGDRGWVEPDLLDPAVRAIVQRMPAGAISDPVRVAGGFEIVNLLGTRKFGEVKETILNIRQVFLPFPSPFQGGQPSPAQLAVLTHANALRGGLHDCDAVSAANAAVGNVRKADPGPVNLATVQPAAFQSLLSSLPIGQISQPLVSQHGVAMVMVCKRATSTTGLPSIPAIANILVQRRVALESQQLMDALHRNAVIERDQAS